MKSCSQRRLVRSFAATSSMVCSAVILDSYSLSCAKQWLIYFNDFKDVRLTAV
jgi:hypothetical protein